MNLYWRINSPSVNPAISERKLGDYALVEEIARGGMGVVWKARDLTLGRLVALKLIRDSQLATASARHRFQIEAEAAAQLQHPNIVPLYEFGLIDGQPFITMPLIAGSNLQAKLRGTPMKPIPLARLMAKLARAIQFAHQRGILHCDLKPANVLLDAQGEPQVTDFGLARRLNPEEPPLLESTIIGSPNYMAPEQAAAGSGPLTTAVDVYSLGAIMYELLTGRAPFQSESPLATLRKVQEEDPIAPRASYKFADRELEIICLKCMEKSPERRYSSAEALAMELERWLNHEPIQAQPITVARRVAKWTRRNPKVATLVILLHVVFVLGLAGIVWMGGRAASQARESRRNMLKMYVATGNRLVEEGQDFSALLWFVEALRLEQGGPVREENHRYRIQAVSRHTPRLVQTVFSGEGIDCAALSPDGTRLLTGGGDGWARVWDTGTGRAMTPPLNHSGPVRRVSFAPDARRILTMDDDGFARVRDATTGEPITPPLRPPDFDAKSMDWSQRKLRPAASFATDGRWILTAWGSKSAHLWDASTGQHLMAFSHQATVDFAAFSDDGRHVVTASQDRTARVWDALTGEPVAAPLTHQGFVAWAQFSPDGQSLLTVSGREIAHIWDWRGGRQLVPPMSHGAVLFAASFSPDGRQVLTASWDMTARVWDTATGLQIGRFDHPGGLMGAEWARGGAWLATACADGTVRVWDVQRGIHALSALPQGGPFLGLVFSADGRRLATYGSNGAARVWDTSNPGADALTLRQPDVVWAEFNRDATRVVTASAWEGRSARVFDARTGAAIGPLLQHSNAVRRATFSPDGKRVLTAGDDFTVRLWEAETGRELLPAVRHPGGVLDAVFSPDGRTFLSGCYDGVARLYDAATGQPLATLVHSKPITSVAFSPDGKLAATGSQDATARVWDVSTGQPVSPPLTHPAEVTSVRFSPDSTSVLSACNSSAQGGAMAQVWEARTGRTTGLPMKHNNSVRSAEFSADARFVVTASEDRSARVWDARTGLPVTPPMWHLKTVAHAVFTPDGHRVATVTTAGDVRLWDALTGEAISPRLPHPHRYSLASLMFSPDGQRLLIATGADSAFIAEFTKADSPVGTLLMQAQTMAGQRIDSSAGIVQLDGATLNRAWRSPATSGN